MGKIIRNGVSYGGSSNAAGNISYDNSTSGLNSTTVQNAITELKRMIGGNNLQQYTTLPVPTSELEGTIVEYVGGTTINYTHGFIYECKEDSSTPGTYIWEAVPVQEDTLIIEDVSELPTTGHIENHFYRVSSSEEDAEITIPSDCDTVEKLKNYFLDNLPLEVASESSNFCHLKQKDGEPLRYRHTDGGTSFYLKDIDIHYNSETEHLKVNISYDDIERDDFTNNEIYTTYYFTTVDTDYYIGDEANQGFSKINTSEEVIEGVGRFERDGQGNILGEYFNKYEDTVDPSTGDVTSARNAATGENSHAEGYGGNTAGGLGSHAEGGFNSIAAGGTFAHAEGHNNSTSGHASHIEGGDNSNIGTFAHVEGNININDMAGFCAHVEGNYNTNVSSVTHTEGEFNVTGNFNLLPADKPVKVVANTSEATDENYDYLIYDNTSRKYKKWTYNSSSEQWESSNLQLIPGPNDVHIEGTRNIGSDGHVEGKYNIAKDNTYSHTEGYDNFSKGAIYSHIEGRSNELKASLLESHIEGTENKVQNQIGGSGLLQESHIEGFDNQVITPNTLTHVEGKSNRIQPNNNNIHIEGSSNTIQNQEITHIEGQNNNINDENSKGYSNHVEGQNNTVKNLNYSHIEGQSNIAQGLTAGHVEGYNIVYGNNALYSHIEGGTNTVGSQASPVTFSKSHIEGDSNQVSAGVASATSLHIEGMSNIAENRGTGASTYIIATHIEGQSNRVDASNTHVEGTSNIVYHGVSTSHIEGTQNHIKGNYSHTEGTYNMNEASQAHTEGQNNTISVEGSTSHVEGSYNTVNSSIVHMEGNSNTIGTNSPYSYVGGQENDVGNRAECSFTSGYYNQNNTDHSFVIGRYNEPDNAFNEISNQISEDDIEDDIVLITSDGTTSSSAGVGTTDFILIQQSIEFKIYAHTMTNDKIYICYYDENKNFLVSDEIEGESGVVNTTRKLNGNDTYKSGTNHSNYYQDAKYMRISADFSSTDLNDAALYFSKPRTLFVIGNGYHDYSQNPAVDVRSNIVEVYNDNVKIYGDTKLKGTIEQEATCKATGDYSNALGTGTIAETNNSTVIGQYNIPDSTMSAQNMFDGTVREGSYSTTTDPTDATFDDYAIEMPYPELNIQTTSRLAIDNNTSLTITAPAGRPVPISGVTPAGDYCVIVCFFDYVGTLIKKEVYYETNKGDLVTHTFTSSYLKTAGAYKVAVCCQLDDQYVDSLSITQTIENLFVIGNGIDNNHRSNIITVSPSETIINNDITLTGNIVITGTIANKTIKSSNSYYGGHMRQDGECPFRYRRMLYFGNYTGDETPKIIVDNTDPQNPVPYQPGYYSLELESYAGLPKAVMKMIENSIYSPDGDFKANMRHIVSYYCALLQHNVKSRIEITSITASSNTFTQDGETYHFPLVNYVILPPWDGSSGTYTGAAILDIVFNNFQA